MAREDITGMKPKMGDSVITLPITFDYSGGRGDKQKSIRIWSIIISIVGVIVAIGVLFGNNEWYIKLPLSVAIFTGVMFLVRYVLFKEGKRKEEYKAMIHNDYEMSYKNIWGIYAIEDYHPYYCRFRNGKSGVYIRLNKDVILGKYSESEYEHYEAVADAYNLAGAGKVQMVHIDYMDNVGSDERLEESFIAIENVSNPDVKDLLTDIYSYQQSNMQRRVTTFDVYAFIWTGNDITAWNTIVRILNCFLDANYRSYQVLNERELRELTKSIYNLNDFSVSDASAYAFDTSDSISIKPISVVNVDGTVEKINKTVSEKEAEKKRKHEEEVAVQKELLRRKNEKKKQKKNKKNKNTDVFDDIF